MALASAAVTSALACPMLASRRCDLRLWLGQSRRRRSAAAQRKIERLLEIDRIQLQQNLAAGDILVIVDVNVNDMPTDARADVGDVGFDECIVGRDEIAAVLPPQISADRAPATIGAQ